MNAAERIAKARAVLIAREPYFGVLALGLQVTERADVDTMATDGVGLFYSPAFVMGLSERELLGVIAHEVEHVARLHITRRGTRDATLWNEACDHAINPGLLAAGFILPRGVLYDARWRGMTAEAIYAALQREGRPQGAQGADPGRCGGVLDAPPGDGRDAMEADVQARVRQAAGIAKRAGRLPASAAETVAALDAPRVSWRDVLRRFADAGARRDVSWTRPSRRDAGDGFILPGAESVSAGRIVCIVDTSASMDRRALTAVAGELQAILDDGAADVVTIVQCDTAVKRATDYTPGDVLAADIVGRGGTRFAPAFAWVRDNAPDAACVVYLTDLDCADFGDAPPCPVLWAATERVRPAPFGDVVLVDVHA